MHIRPRILFLRQPGRLSPGTFSILLISQPEMILALATSVINLACCEMELVRKYNLCYIIRDYILDTRPFMCYTQCMIKNIILSYLSHEQPSLVLPEPSSGIASSSLLQLSTLSVSFYVLA